MLEQYETSPPVALSAQTLEMKKSRLNQKKKILRLQTTKPAKTSVKIQPELISIHFKWALFLTITCFFVIGPCWALYKTSEIRRLIARKEFSDARRLSTKLSVILTISTIIGVFIWVSALFCSVGLLLTGILLKNKFI